MEEVTIIEDLALVGIIVSGVLLSLYTLAKKRIGNRQHHKISLIAIFKQLKDGCKKELEEQKRLRKQKEIYKVGCSDDSPCIFEDKEKEK